MGVNDDRLSAGEQNELRALVTAGAGRMRAARRRRMQAITGGAAVLLVAAVVGAVALTAMGSPDRVATPIETDTTATPTPEPTPDPTQVAPTAPVAAFGGDCANLVDTDWLTQRVGLSMREEPLAWPYPALELNGALSCWWIAPESYASPRLEITVLPSTAQDGEALATSELSCADEAGTCVAAVAANGTWMFIRAYAARPADWVPQLIEDLVARAEQHPTPQRAERAAGWWSLPDCEWIASVATPKDAKEMAAGESDSLLDSLSRESASGLAGYETSCNWLVPIPEEFGGNGDASAGVTVVPGGAQFFDAIAASERAEPVTVAGADRATTASGLDRLEAYDARLVVTSGENMLIITGDNGLPPESLAYLVEPYLTALNATLG
ncbi:hypothetical protein [Microbacterium sp. RG1]|uniref:hypothetical protein n=1 Tax=Microbacterium sp. RG1 TaxID=2489212 RepID=UPI0010CA350B|nr:hypothetical protein [Microbacterium sp. RG1]QCQ15533.1 hypothetical protein EHF32_01625 [Microbacterium sp. RG1]